MIGGKRARVFLSPRFFVDERPLLAGYINIYIHKATSISISVSSIYIHIYVYTDAYVVRPFTLAHGHEVLSHSATPVLTVCARTALASTIVFNWTVSVA